MKQNFCRYDLHHGEHGRPCGVGMVVRKELDHVITQHPV